MSTARTARSNRSGRGGGAGPASAATSRGCAAGSSAANAAALSDRLTVHLYNRRGRPDTASLTGDETMQTDLDDLAAVLRHTGADAIFGHSGGGFVAMRAGRPGITPGP